MNAQHVILGAGQCDFIVYVYWYISVVYRFRFMCCSFIHHSVEVHTTSHSSQHESTRQCDLFPPVHSLLTNRQTAAGEKTQLIASTRGSTARGRACRSGGGRTRSGWKTCQRCPAYPGLRGRDTLRRGGPGRSSCGAPRRRRAWTDTCYRRRQYCAVSFFFRLNTALVDIDRRGGGGRKKKRKRTYRPSSFSLASLCCLWNSSQARWMVQCRR